jgi:endoglucanase
MSLRTPGIAAAAVLLSLGLTACEGEGGGASPSAFGPRRLEAAGGPTASSAEWLVTEGNRIVRADGSVWVGRGMNIHDTRSCNACTNQAPDVEEVKRRIDEAVDVWGADFLRLNMESYAGGGRVHEDPITHDADYFDDILEIVDYIGTKDGVYVLLSLWHDPTFNELGWPTEATAATWELLTMELADAPHVLFGLVNEPQANFDGARDAEVWEAMNDTVAAIRNMEATLGVPHRIIAVQGTRAWARWLGYYVERPIEAGGGENIVYETHVYNSEDEFEELFEIPSESLPVIIGEFGPLDMTMADSAALMARAEALEIPYLAWTFHQRCPPNLLVDHSEAGCGVGMPLEPTPWGEMLMERLAAPVR